MTIPSEAQAPLLLVNQTIGPLFADLAAATEQRAPVVLFRGLAYRRTPTTFRLLTWAGFVLQLAWHLLWRGRSYQRLLLVSNPPFAPLLAPLARRPYALLLYDLYPQVLAQLQPHHRLGRSALALVVRLWQSANRRVFVGAERVFTLSPAMAEQLRPAFATEALWRRRVLVIPPWANTAQLKPSPAAAKAFRRQHGLSGLSGASGAALLLTYAGNLGLTHPLEPLLQAAALLQALPNQPRLQVLLIGQGPKRAALEQQARALKLPPSRLRFLEPLPYGQLAGALSAADLAVVALDGPAAAASLPSKTFSALACGTPLLALAPTTSALAQLVQQHHCGLVIEPGPGAARQLAEAISRLLNHPAELRQLAANALAAARHYTPANAEQLLDAWLGPKPATP
jgi:colanic acid biosynthesis glycosyl transferase WcaI